MTSEDCIFCRIIAGELPATRIYEDDGILAFMDIRPIVKGHALVIPKAHYDPITGTPDDVLGKTIAVVKRVARAQMQGLEADGVNVTQANGAVAGQEIAHIHFHVIPRHAGDDAPVNWRPRSYDSDEEREAFGRRLRDAMA